MNYISDVFACLNLVYLRWYLWLRIRTLNIKNPGEMNILNEFAVLPMHRAEPFIDDLFRKAIEKHRKKYPCIYSLFAPFMLH